MLSNSTIGACKIHCTVINGSIIYALIDHLECIDRITQTYSHIVSTLIGNSSNKHFTARLFILEHNTSIMGSMKSIVDKILGNSQKHFEQNFELISPWPTLYSLELPVL